MDLGLISVRYARALLKACTDAKLSAAVYVDMQNVANSYAQVPALKVTIDNPMLSKEQKKNLLMAAAGADRCELTERFIELVLSEGREGIMQFMAHSFVDLYRKQNNLIRARLVTATAPSEQVEGKLRKLVGSQIMVRWNLFRKLIPILSVASFWNMIPTVWMPASSRN